MGRVLVGGDPVALRVDGADVRDHIADDDGSAGDLVVVEARRACTADLAGGEVDGDDAERVLGHGSAADAQEQAEQEGGEVTHAPKLGGHSATSHVARATRPVRSTAPRYSVPKAGPCN